MIDSRCKKRKCFYGRRKCVLLDINPFIFLLDISRTLFDGSNVVKSIKNILKNIATCKVMPAMSKLILKFYQ